MLPYEILIRSVDGKYTGAHVLDTPSGTARAIQPTDWPALVTGINAAAMAAVTALQLEKTNLTAALQREKTKSSRIGLAVTRIDSLIAAGKPEEIGAIVTEAKTAIRTKEQITEEAAAARELARQNEARADALEAESEAAE